MPARSSQSAVPAEFTVASRGERLQKVLAAAGVASRRQCEQLIEKGAVTVNGQIVAGMPAWVNPTQDHICVDGKPIQQPKQKPRRPMGGRADASARDAEPQPHHKHVYVILHKPRNVISTTRDPQGRRSVTDLVDLPASNPDARPPRLYPVGRLDADSAGLILLTNDGDLANRLTHPRYEVPKLYEVSVRGRVTQDDLDRLQSGMFLAHRGTGERRPAAKRASVAQVRMTGHGRDRAGNERTTLQLTLHEGQNREIRRLLVKLGFKVRRLKRLAIGPINLKGLAAGQWRHLTGAELSRLRRTAGLPSKS